MREELVPQVVGEVGRYVDEDVEQVGFEGGDGTFEDVAVVDIGEHELVCGLPDVSDVVTVILAGFVVKDLVVNDVDVRLEAGHDAGVCRDTVEILAGLKGFDEDDVGVTMVGDHELPVAAAGADLEAARVVGVDRAGGLDPEVELFRRVRQVRVIEGGGRRVRLISACGLGGADALL